MEVNEFWNWLGESWMVVAFLFGAIILGSRAWGPIKSFLTPWIDNTSKTTLTEFKEHFDTEIAAIKKRLDDHENQCQHVREHVNQMLENILKKLDRQEHQYMEQMERMVRVETRVEENTARIGKK